MNKIAGLLLAAGGSRRLGRPKQLLLWKGEPLVHRAARVALEAGVDPLVVVLGAHADEIRAALEDLELSIVDHPNWKEGLGSSIACGMRAIANKTVLVMLADQPGVDERLLAQLIESSQAGHARVASGYADGLGVPAVFSKPSDLDALRQLTGDQGARRLLAAAPEAVCTIAAPEAAHDIDDESDWSRWREKDAREHR